MTEVESALLHALQRGLPLESRPFAVLARSCGADESSALALLERLRAEGTLRRLGAVYDARRLGWKSALCAVRAGEALERLAAIAAAEPGVTHCYARRPLNAHGASPYPELWFTFAAPAERFDAGLAALREKMAPANIYALPATRRFKIDVVFDLRTRRRDESTAPGVARAADDFAPVALTAEEWRLIRATQGDLEIRSDFFAAVAEKIGSTESAVLEKLCAWKASGVLRRLGAILRHRELGFKANGMCCWNPPENQVMEAGRKLASFPEVTHCYERPWTEIFPFRLYAMIHTPSFEETEKLFQTLSARAGLVEGTVLLSVREFKKTSLVL